MLPYFKKPLLRDFVDIYMENSEDTPEVQEVRGSGIAAIGMTGPGDMVSDAGNAEDLAE